MKKSGIMLLVFLSSALLFTETLETGDTGTLGIETSTTFLADLNDGSSGLETKVGIEAIFNLFPKKDRGVIPENSDTPTVKIELKNSSFTWWNKYKSEGGNFEQDDFNSWTAQPLVINFESLTTDVVWKDYYFRVAGSKSGIKSNSSSLQSIFDDVMDASENRWYINRKKALYYSERYNVLELPILGDSLNRDLVNVDLQDEISGQLGFGAEFESWNIDALVGSLANGKDNDDNSWVFNIDSNIHPLDNIEITTDLLIAINLGLDKAVTPEAYQNPIAFGFGVKYLINPESDIKVLPFIGADSVYEQDSMELNWELGGGVFVYFSNIGTFTSHRSVDRDEVITQGLSFSVNLDNNDESNMIFAFFDDTTTGSLFGNFGGFTQFEMANMLSSNGQELAWAVAGQLEYLFNGKALPYVREKISPNSGETLYNTVVGLELTPINNLLLDFKYEREDTESSSIEDDYGLISIEFNISL